MVTENNDKNNGLENEDISEELTDEITAAVAELKAAQEKLDAAKAKLEEEKAGVSEASTASDIPAEAPIILDAVPMEASSVASEAAQKIEEDPNWVPYTPGQTQTANAGGTAAAPQPTSPYDANAGGTAAAPQPPYYTPSAYNAAPQNPPTGMPPQGSYQYQQTPPQQTYYPQGYAQPVTTKDHVAAGLLAIFLGSLGIHKFYLGYNTAGFIMLAVTILGSLITFGLAGAVVALIGFIEGIMYLIKSQSEFEYLYVFNKREWF